MLVKIVLKVLVVVTVTVMTRCALGHAVASAVLQSFAVGVVLENTPALVAHSQSREALAVMPVTLVAAVAADCMPAVLMLLPALDAPHCAPARAASVRAMPV